jgi:glycogen(starch) synthase
VTFGRGRAARDRCQVLLVGGYPPLYGGVNVHVQRLAAALSEHVEVRVLDYLRDTRAGWDSEVPYVYRAGHVHLRRSRVLRIVWRLSRFDCDLVHFHAGSLSNFALLALPMLLVLPRSSRKVLTIHSGSMPAQVRSASTARRLLLTGILGCFDLIICVSSDIQDAVASLCPMAPTRVIPAFLPPVMRSDPAIDKTIRQLRMQGVERVFVVSGFAKSYYGFHVVLDALETHEYLAGRIGIVFAFYSHYDEPYHRSVVERLGSLQVKGVSFDNLDPERFAFLLSQTDGIIRPTDRDGDSIAVREARAMGKQVIASDCVERPLGTLLFETMSADSLATALRLALDDREAGTGVEHVHENWLRLTEEYASLGVPLAHAASAGTDGMPSE